MPCIVHTSSPYHALWELVIIFNISLQAALLDSLYGIERGLSARSEIRAEINELISQLEAKNPTPNPTEVSL